MNEVAQIILQQLGGRRFMVMTGASHFVGSPTALTFALPRTAHYVQHGITKVRVILEPSDTYTVEFWRTRSRGKEVKVDLICREEDIYAENLQDCFTRVTGLVTHL